MAKQLIDDEAKLKRKARRRLIGAVALTTAIVVLLPMLLDSDPRPVGQDIELRIPDKDKAGEFVPKIGLSPASATAVAPPVFIPVSAPVIADTAIVASQVVAAPKAPESSPATPAPKPAAEPVKPEAAAPEQVSHKPEPRPEGKTKTGPQQGFVVQIGAFTKAETAHKWKENLGKQGIKAYTEKAGDKTRVRAGPYATREAADKVRHKLEAQGLQPVVSQAQ